MKFTLFAACVLGQTALEIIASSPVHKTLATLAGGIPEIAEVLKSSGPLTVFAPTDDAFKALPAATLEAVQKDSQLLASVLKYHVIAGVAFNPQQAEPKSFPKTANGQLLGVTVKEGKVTLSYGLSSAMVTSSVLASNGVVHVIDKVLVPPPSASATAQAANLTELISALQKVNLVQTVDGAKDVTILAPSNEAFAKLTAFAQEQKLEITPAILEAVLKLHVIPSVLTSVDLSKQASTSAKALSGKQVTVTSEDGKVMVKGDGNPSAGSVVVADVLIEGGVVHVIDQVLLPNLSEPLVESTSGAFTAGVGALLVAIAAQFI